MSNEKRLVERAERMLFLGVLPKSDGGDTVFYRLNGLTSASESKNPKEYSRQYVDKSFETSNVVGYTPSVSASIDEYLGDPAAEEIIGIIENEQIGTSAIRDMVQVNFSQPVDGGYRAVKRSWSVIGESSGDSTDASTFSFSLKVSGDRIEGIATILIPAGGNPKNAETISFTANSEKGE